MRHITPRFAVLLALGALTVASCGGSDDAADVADLSEDATEAPVDDDVEEPGDSESDSESDADDGSAAEATFGEFISGEIAVTGAEEVTYSVDDPTLEFVNGGGCSADNFAMTVQAREADTGFTAMQLTASVEDDLNGGATGTYEVEEMTLLTVTDGDMAAGRTYAGPATMVVSEHDTGGATADPNARRMAITLDGTLAASSDGGEVEVAADVLWVMGCP